MLVVEILLNLAVTMGSDVNGIRLLPFSVYLAPSTSLSSPSDYALTSYAPKSILVRAQR